MHEDAGEPRSSLAGRWRVRRISGLLLPFGITKRIEAGAGNTCLFGVPVGAFDVRDTTLEYRRWPVRDVLEPRPDGCWNGEGRVFGVMFCRFLLEPIA